MAPLLIHLLLTFLLSPTLVLTDNTNLKAAIYSLVNTEAKQSFDSLKKVWSTIQLEDIEQENAQPFNALGVHILSRKYSSEELKTGRQISLNSSIHFGHIADIYEITPEDITFDADALLSVLDIEGDHSNNGRFANNDPRVELVSRVVAYNWQFSNSMYSLSSHRIKIKHDPEIDVEKLQEENFQMSERRCLSWSDSEVQWKIGQTCFVSAESPSWTECSCYDNGPTSDPVVVAVEGTPKSSLKPEEFVPENSVNVVEAATQVVPLGKENIAYMQPLVQVNANEKGNSEGSRQVLKGKEHRYFERHETMPLFTKIADFMMRDVRNNVQTVTDIRELKKHTSNYILEEHSGVSGAKIDGSALNHHVDPKGILFSPEYFNPKVGLHMSRKFLTNFMFLKTVEIGIAVSDRDYGEFPLNLEDHLSVASDIVTIAIETPENPEFSLSSISEPVSILIPVTKGQRVSNPKCYRLDENNVLQDAQCSVDDMQASKVIKCTCVPFTRSFLIVDDPRPSESPMFPVKQQRSEPVFAIYEPSDLVLRTTSVYHSTDPKTVLALASILPFLLAVTAIYCRFCCSPGDSSLKQPIEMLWNVIICLLLSVASLLASQFVKQATRKTVLLAVHTSSILALSFWIWALYAFQRSKINSSVKGLILSIYTVSVIVGGCHLTNLTSNQSSHPTCAFVAASLGLVSLASSVLFRLSSKSKLNWVPANDYELNSNIETRGLDVDANTANFDAATEQSDNRISPNSDLKSSVLFAICGWWPLILLLLNTLLCGSLSLYFVSNNPGWLVLFAVGSNLLSLIATVYLGSVVWLRPNTNQVINKLDGKRSLRSSEVKDVQKCENKKREPHLSGCSASSNESGGDVEVAYEADEQSFSTPC